jgi:hypothetical protein
LTRFLQSGENASGTHLDACGRVYQIAVGKQHGVNRSRLHVMVGILKATPQNLLKLYFVILEDRLPEFEWKWEGEFELDDEVMRLEKSTIKVLENELNGLKQLTKGNKADLHCLFTHQTRFKDRGDHSWNTRKIG